MSVEDELRRMLRHVDELPAPDLRPGVMPLIAPRKPQRMFTGLMPAAAAGLAVALLAGTAWLTSTNDAPDAASSLPPAGQSSTVSSPTSLAPNSSDMASPTPAESSSRPEPVGGLIVATDSQGGGGGDALGVGRLGGRVTDKRACIWLEPTAEAPVGAVRTALIWPDGFGAVDGPLRLLGPDGQVLAQMGDVVELGGGGPAVDYLPTSEQDPCQIGRVFFVSVVVTVNGNPVNAGAGPLEITTRPPGDTGVCSVTFLNTVMLVMSGDRLRLRMDGSDWEVTWPQGLKAMPGERITIVDGDGAVVLRQGDESSTVRGRVVRDRIEVCGFGEVTYR